MLIILDFKLKMMSYEWYDNVYTMFLLNPMCFSHFNILWPTVHLQIEDITRKLRSGDLGIPPNPEDRFV